MFAALVFFTGSYESGDEWIEAKNRLRRAGKMIVGLTRPDGRGCPCDDRKYKNGVSVNTPFIATGDSHMFVCSELAEIGNELHDISVAVDEVEHEQSLGIRGHAEQLAELRADLKRVEELHNALGKKHNYTLGATE